MSKVSKSSLRLSLSVALLGAVGAVMPGESRAAENGVGLYLLGSRGPMAGYLPPPGFYIQNDIYYYDGKTGGSRRFPAGGKVLARVEGLSAADFLTSSWVLPDQILGGNFSIGAILPYGRAHVRADINVDPVGPLVFRGSAKDRAWIFADPVGSAVLGWHSGNFHWNVMGLLNFPVGHYREDQIANLAFHRWAGDLSAALTWMDPKIGIDLSGTAGVTFNGKNQFTDYTTGTEFHVEWAASKQITKEFSAGILGYHYQQISADTGTGATLGPYKGRVTALGGTVAYNFEAGKTPISTRLKVFREFSAKNRLTGTVGIFTVAFPIGGK